MNSLQITRSRANDLAAKQALREHIDMLPSGAQREFIELALQMIAERNLIDEVEAQVSYQQPAFKSKRSTTH